MKICTLTFSPASRLFEGRSQEHRSGAGAPSSLHSVHRCRWAGRNRKSKWKLAYPIMALTSGRHPSLIASPLTEWAIWAAEKAATGPLPSWWPCPLGAAPARQPSRAGSGRARHSLRQAGACIHHSRIQAGSKKKGRKTRFSLFNTVVELVSAWCACGGCRGSQESCQCQSEEICGSHKCECCLFSLICTQAMQE